MIDRRTFFCMLQQRLEFQSFIGEVVEDIVSIQSLLASLLVAKDEVYPLEEVGRNIVTLQSL